jgi:hypothetical protein
MASIKECTSLEKETDTESLSGRMDKAMREIGDSVKRMDMEFGNL